MKELLEQIRIVCAEFDTNAIALVEQGNKVAGQERGKIAHN